MEEETNETRREHLLTLEKEGQMFRVTSPDAAKIWGSVLGQLPDDQRKFALNSALDTLPHNANLCLWRKRVTDSCPLCHERQSLIHVLNACPRALETRRYNLRHDSVLEKIVTTISTHLQPSERMCSDLSEYNFPQHITPTTLRPDTVVWDDVKKKLLLVELTVCFETTFSDAAQRKRAKYEELQESAQKMGYQTSLITLEVGSRGMINPPGFICLQKHIGITDRDLSTLLQSLSHEAILQSYRIWCLRNHHS